MSALSNKMMSICGVRAPSVIQSEVRNEVKSASWLL